MKKNIKSVLGAGLGTIVGLSFAPSIGNSAKAVSSNPNMGAAGSAMADTFPTLYMASLYKPYKKMKF